MKVEVSAAFCLQIGHSKAAGQRIPEEPAIGEGGPYANKGAVPGGSGGTSPARFPTSENDWMDTTFYCFRVPMNDNGEKARKECCKVPMWLWALLLLGLVAAGLVVAVISLDHRLKSEACQHGLEIHEKCQNTIDLLESRLAHTQKGFLGAQAQATACNVTVENLTASLEMEKTHGQKNQALIEELKGEIENLNQMLQEKMVEVEQLRKEKENYLNQYTSTNSSTAPRLQLAAEFFLLLGLLAVLL